MEHTTNERDDLQAEAQKLGRRIGLLLAAADMPNEQKEAWASLITEMTAQQMEDFAVALETRVPDAGEEAFKGLADKLSAANARRDETVARATGDANDALNAIADEISSPPTP